MSRWWRWFLSASARLGPPAGPADDGEGGVEHRDPEDEERDDQRGEEEVGPAVEVDVGLADHRHGGRGHQQTEQHGAGVAHEDPGRVEVVGQEPEAQADDDHREERSRALRPDGAPLDQLVGVEEERQRGDAHDPRGQPVQAVDEVDRVGHADHPQHGHHRDQIGREHHGRAGEGQSEEQHVDAEQVQDGAGEDLAGHLGGRRHLAQVVDHADGEDHRRGQDHSDGVGRPPEQARSGRAAARPRPWRRQQAQVHGGPADGRASAARGPAGRRG